MRLADAAARSRLSTHDHGVLCTLHPERGIDATPAVYAATDRFVGVPIDTVKPKASTRLQRERNLEADPRATLLVEHWDRDDWSQLWWVRAELRWRDDGAGRQEELADQLVDRFVQYRARPFAGMLVFEIGRVTGWAAG